MKIIKKVLVLIFILIPVTTFWNDNINSDIKKAYLKFYINLNNKYDDEQTLSYLNDFSDNISLLSDSYKLNSSNSYIVSDIQKLNNEKIFDLELKISESVAKKAIDSNTLFDNYKVKLYNEKSIVKENWIWYAYIFDKNYFFNDLSKINIQTLEYNWLTWDDVILSYENSTVNFVKQYEKKMLISDSIIYGFPDKYEFLETLKYNKLYTSWNDDKSFKELKDLSLELTKWIYNDSEKIKIIYWYILENINYTLNFSMDDYEIFSGIETFKNKDWVCEWYVELFNSMLWFNWIESKIVTWDVINASDFPDIWHAWVKIWDYYYDPTFDDPVWLVWDYEFKDYSYYKIPEDLFYTNRYNYWKTPDNLKNTTLDYRENIIHNNLLNLFNKYKYGNYRLLNPFYFRSENSLELDSQITINTLIDIMWEYKMEKYSLEIDWETKNVKNISYVTLTQENIESYLNQINYDLDWYKLIKWTQNNWETQYVITNEITYH